MTTNIEAPAGFAPLAAMAFDDGSGLAQRVSGANPMPMADGGVADAAVTTASVTSAADVVSLATAGYAGGSFQISSIGSGNTVTFEQSNDNTNWIALPVNAGGNTFSANSSTATATGIYYFTAYAAYVRARVSTYGSGTVTISACRKRQKPVGDFSGQTVLGAGTSLIGSLVNVLPYTDSTTALGSSATYTGTGRATTGLTYATKFKARVIADQAGTLYIEQSVDGGSNYRIISTTGVVAGTVANAVVDVTGAYGSSNLYRVRFVNGASAQTYMNLTSCFASA